jgi:hypothetical protein
MLLQQTHSTARRYYHQQSIKPSIPNVERVNAIVRKVIAAAGGVDTAVEAIVEQMRDMICIACCPYFKIRI